MAKVNVDDEKDQEIVDDESQDELEDDQEIEDEDDAEDGDDTSDDEDSEDEETEDDEEDEPQFKKRYTQIKGETPEEYIPNLETAYKNSSAEAVRLKQKVSELEKQLDNITALVAKNPELAEQIKEGKVEVPTDPALLKARQDMEAQNKKEYAEFVDAHPELESDPELQAEVFEAIKDFAAVAAKKNRVLGMKEALTMAWTSLGLTPSKDEQIRMKAKETAARGKSAGTGKKAVSGKQTFTESQIQAGLQMGLGNTREEVIKKLKAYA